MWCDTKYTWDWKYYERKLEVAEISVAEVEENLDVLTIDNLVVTGGEPLLQQEALALLLAGQKGKGRRIEIETNGTITPERNLDMAVEQWNVSPKLANSGEPESRRIVDTALWWFRENPKACFKFVIQSDDDIVEVERLVKRIRFPRSRCFLMPEASDAEMLKKRGPRIVEYCVKFGFRCSPRLQVEKWGGTRGR
jgi:organic radical activating enzyme